MPESTMIQLRPSQLEVLLIEAIKNLVSICVIGEPGVGKTSIMRAACRKVDSDLVITNAGLNDPTDAKGFPWMEKGSKQAQFVPFGDTAKVLASTKLTTWFLDDLGHASPQVQVSYMPWLPPQRGVNGHTLPEHVVIMAATNERTHKAGVSGLLEPVKSRFASIVKLVVDNDEWCQWAVMQPHMPPDMIAYLRFSPESLHKFVPTADLVNSPSPRTWEAAGRLVMLGLPKAVEAPALAGAVGEEEATKYLAFREMYRQLPSIDGIFLDPEHALIPENLGALYAVVTGLAAKTNEQNFTRVVKYVQRLVDGARGDFAALCIRDAARRTPTLQQTPDFVRLMSGELGALITGATR